MKKDLSVRTAGIYVQAAQENCLERRQEVYNMVSLAVGTVCMKVAGRESGAICCVVKPIDKTFIMVTGPKLVTGIKRRRCNIEHLEPTEIKLEIKEDATDEEIIEAYKKANVITKFNLKLPSAGEMKAEKTKVQANPEKRETRKESKDKKTEEKK